jgi:hypothetical protein
MPEHEQIADDSDREETARIERAEELTDDVRDRLERAERAGDAMKAARHGRDNVMSIQPTRVAEVDADAEVEVEEVEAEAEAPTSHGSDRGMSIQPTPREQGEAIERRAEAHLRQLRQPAPRIPPPTPDRFRSRENFERVHGKSFPVTQNVMTPIMICADGIGFWYSNGGGTTYREESDGIKIMINRLSFARVRLKQAQDALNAYQHERWADHQHAPHTYTGGGNRWNEELLGPVPLDDRGQLTLAGCIEKLEFLVSYRRRKVAWAEENLARVAPHLAPEAAARLQREDAAAMARFQAERHNRLAGSGS